LACATARLSAIQSRDWLETFDTRAFRAKVRAVVPSVGKSVIEMAIIASVVLGGACSSRGKRVVGSTAAVTLAPDNLQSPHSNAERDVRDELNVTDANTITALSIKDASDASSKPTPTPSVCGVQEPNALSAKSPDGMITVFVSTDETRIDPTALGEVVHENLCIRRNGGPPTLLLAGRLLAGRGMGAPGPEGAEETLAGFYQFLFSSDSKTLYVNSLGWATNGGAHAIDLATGKERFLCVGQVTSVIGNGPYKDDLLCS
jgi:hypothetical protein